MKRSPNSIKKSVVICLTLFVLSIIAIIIVWIINLQKTASVEILVAPSFAKITMNGKTIRNQSTIKTFPSEDKANITISANGFKSQEFQISLTPQQQSYIVTYLVPDDGSMDWYTNHPNEDNLLTQVGEKQAELESVKYSETNPISKILPIVYVDVDPITYDWVEYRIDGGNFEDCEGTFCVKITDSTGGNEEKALEQIRMKGYDPDDYEIIYKYTPVLPLE